MHYIHLQTRQQEADSHANSGKKQHVLIAKSRAIKDGKTIPNLVFKIEAFERDVIKLGKRCKIDLFGDKSPKISTSRDFRVKEIENEEEPEISHAPSKTLHEEQENAEDDSSDDNDHDVS